MKKHLFGVALALSLVLVSGLASAQTIDDIQLYDALGAPISPYAGTVVTVTGVLHERGQYSTGSNYIQGATGGISIYQSAPGVVLGDLVEVTGTVGAFGGEIQLGTATFVALSSGNTATVTPMTITDMMSDYENVGWLVETIGTVQTKNTADFWLTDGTDSVMVYIDSTTGIDIGAVAVGDTYKVISPVVVYNGQIELKPRFQTDLIENPTGDTLPVISAINCGDWSPMAADAIVVTADIVDDLGVGSATLYYRDSDGVTPGGFSSVAMSVLVGNTWTGTIPGGHSLSQVDFYVEATDTGAQTVTLPGDAPVGFVSVAVGLTSIYDMQTAHPDSLSQSNGYVGKALNIRGVVTAGTGQVGSASKLIVQEPAVNPATGTYAFGGVLVYESSGAGLFFQGDLVEIGGEGDEYYGLTEMIPHNGNAIEFVDFGQDLPPASIVPTRILADDVNTDGNGFLGEAWESVWVKTFPAAVLDTLGYGDYIVADKDSRADSLVISPLVTMSYVPVIGDVITVEGYTSYDYGAFVIVPVSDEFIVQTGLSATDDTPNILKSGGLRGVYPNPFNPVTNIKFVVNKESLVQLNVYNIKGEKVRTMLQDRLPANEYSVVWDGKSDGGENLASGTYFARLRIGGDVMQVRKMTLVK